MGLLLILFLLLYYNNVVDVLNAQPPLDVKFNTTLPLPSKATVKYAPSVDPISTVDVSLYTTVEPFHTDEICPERALPPFEIV